MAKKIEMTLARKKALPVILEAARVAHSTMRPGSTTEVRYRAALEAFREAFQ